MTLLETTTMRGVRTAVVLEHVQKIIDYDGKFAELVFTNGYDFVISITYDQLMEILREKCGSTIIDISGL